MAKVRIEVGYGLAVDKGAGVHEVDIQVRKYYGEMQKESRRLDTGDSINGKFRLENTYSILADNFARENTFAIRYVKYKGSVWEVTSVAHDGARLLLRMGGVYRGKTL